MDIQVSEGKNAAYRGESEPVVFCFCFFALVSVDFGSHRDAERQM